MPVERPSAISTSDIRHHSVQTQNEIASAAATIIRAAASLLRRRSPTPPAANTPRHALHGGGLQSPPARLFEVVPAAPPPVSHQSWIRDQPRRERGLRPRQVRLPPAARGGGGDALLSTSCGHARNLARHCDAGFYPPRWPKSKAMFRGQRARASGKLT